MASGELDCVVATSSLDLGLDWAKVDLVIQVGAPKGVSRLLQRIGRSNHRLEEPSRAILVPTNKFEYLECLAAQSEIANQNLDGVTFCSGGYDVLAQHIFGIACSGPFAQISLFKEILTAAPYAGLKRETFDKIIEFVKNGGYVLREYPQYNRLVNYEMGVSNSDPRNGKTIPNEHWHHCRSPMMKVKLGNRNLGTIEENFIVNLTARRHIFVWRKDSCF